MLLIKIETLKVDQIIVVLMEKVLIVVVFDVPGKFEHGRTIVILVLIIIKCTESVILVELHQSILKPPSRVAISNLSKVFLLLLLQFEGKIGCALHVYVSFPKSHRNIVNFGVTSAFSDH